MVTCKMAAAEAALAHLTVAGGRRRRRDGRVARKGSDRTAVNVVMAWNGALGVMDLSMT
jgi:hypothetical protein